MKLLAIVFVAFLSATPALAEGRCAGLTPQHHSRGSYDFSTNSRVESDGKFSKYFACVENNDQDDWLRLSWFIPLMNERWVPPGGALEEFRLSSDANARPVLGCLQYGNLQDKVVAQLLGDTKDEQRSGGTNEVECRSSLGFDMRREDVVELPPNGILHEQRVYVPTDLKDPIGSMLEVNVSFGVKPTSDGYNSFFSYSVDSYKGSTKANPASVRLRPKFSHDAEALYAAFTNQMNADYVQVEKQGAFNFTIAGAKHWRIEPVVYEFVDKDDNVLTTLHVSLFAPAEPR
ncbi:hypothetical protein ABIA16_004620 [Sinorhizobium fredii]